MAGEPRGTSCRRVVVHSRRGICRSVISADSSIRPTIAKDGLPAVWSGCIFWRGGGALEAGGKITRRTFLQNGALVAALSAVPLSFSHAAAAESARVIGHLVQRAAPPHAVTFAPLLGSTFRMSGAGTHHDVVLAEIDDLIPSKTTDSENRLSLVFSWSPTRPRTRRDPCLSPRRDRKLRHVRRSDRPWGQSIGSSRSSTAPDNDERPRR